MSDLTPRTWKVPETELFSVPLPRETRTYKPVSHRELADVTMDAIHKSGFILDRQSYSSAKDGNVANGRFTIKNVADSEMQLQIGWQNSYDKSLSLKFAIGTRILVCANGCVSGDFGSFKKKHVGEVATFAPAAIMEYIKKAGEAFTRMQVQRDAMKEIEVSKQIQAELIGRMFIEKNIIKSTQLNIIKDELRHATHDYKAEGSLWELYNFTTFALKETHPANWMRDHINAHDFFVSSTGLLLPRTHADEPMSPPGSPYEMAAEAMDVIDAEIIH
jgi:hypothetical protein